MFCVRAMSLRSLRCIPVDELVSAFRREVLVTEEVLCAFNVVVRTIFVFLRNSVVELVLQTCVSKIYALTEKLYTLERRESCP